VDDPVKLSYSHNGKECSMVLPKLLHLMPFAANMREVVCEFLRGFEAETRKVKYLVDVGASIGAWAIPYSFIFPDIEILAIEPSEYNMRFLKTNCEDFPNIELVKIIAHYEKSRLRIAAPDIVQRPDIPTSRPEAGLISVYGTSNHYVEMVDADTLDNIVDEDKVVDWLKVDVEGHELPVLEGASRILERDRPVLQVELRSENQEMAQSTIWKVNKYIMSNRYSMRGDYRGDVFYIPSEYRAK